MPDPEKKTIGVPISGNDSLRNHSNTPNESIENHTKKMAKEAGERMVDWHASFAALINDVRSFYSTKVNEIVAPINNLLTNYLNGLRWNIERRPEEILEEVKHQFDETRQKAFTHRKDYAKFKKKLTREKKTFPDLEEEDVRKTRTKSTGDWVMFFGFMAILVLLESGANTTLLSSVVEGGIVGAFIIATLVSAINVIGFGTGVGFLCAFLMRKVTYLFYTACAAWLVFALFLNLEVGRRREQFVLDIEAKEKAAENANTNNADSVDSLQNLVVPIEELADVSFNITLWQFESVLFFLLGIVLCCFGFYKGITFFAPGENLKSMLDKIDNLNQKIQDDIGAIPQKGRQNLTAMREEVGEQIKEFDANRRTAENQMEDMEQSWDSLITVIKTEFVNSYNRAHPQQRITLKTLEENPITANFPATPADKKTLEEASLFIRKYTESGQGDFYNEIASINKRITERQGEYRSSIDDIMHSEHQTND